MVYDQRRPINEFFGTLSAACTALDTSIQSALFTSLPTDYTTTLYLPLVIANDTTGVYEVIYVTGHASTSNTVTVLRGQEGTSAVAWPNGTVIRAAPTVRDGIQPATTAAMTALTNVHTGCQVVATDTGRLMEKTKTQGWVGTVGTVQPLSTYVQGTAPTTDEVPLLIGGKVAMATVGPPTATSVYHTSLTTGFAYLDTPTTPTSTQIAVTSSKYLAGSDASFARADYCGAEIAGTNTRLWFVCVNGSNAVLANGLQVVFSVVAIGA